MEASWTSVCEDWSQYKSWSGNVNSSSIVLKHHQHPRLSLAHDIVTGHTFQFYTSILKASVFCDGEKRPVSFTSQSIPRNHRLHLGSILGPRLSTQSPLGLIHFNISPLKPSTKYPKNFQSCNSKYHELRLAIIHSITRRLLSGCLIGNQSRRIDA